MLALLGAHLILHVSEIMVNKYDLNILRIIVRKVNESTNTGKI